MKKYLPLFALFIALLLLGGCDQLATTSTTQNDATSTIQDVASTVSMEELAEPTASLGSLIGPFLSNSNAEVLNFTLLEEPVADEPLVDDDIDELDRYLDLVGQFLTEDHGMTLTITNSDREEYTYMATYSMSTLYDGVKTYVLYYNEILPEDDETATDPSSDQTTEETTTLSFSESAKFTFNCTDNDDESVTALIEGLLVDGDTETLLEGAFIETDTDQIVRLFGYIDENNYVKVTAKTDLEDQTKTFFYLVVTDDVVVSESKIKVSTEENKLHVKLELINQDTTTKFDAKVETEDLVTTIKIRYEIMNPDGLLEGGHVVITKTLDEETGDITYDYNVLPDGWMHGHHYSYEHHKHDGSQETCMDSKQVPVDEFNIEISEI